MSVELITIILGAATLVVTIVGGLFAASAWILRHTAQQMDARFAQSDARNDERFAQADANVNARFDKVNEQFKGVNEQFKEVNEQFREMGAEISGLRTELNDVKVAVARLEGPHQRLIFPPH